MGVEIERKFLIKDDSWREKATDANDIKQGYLNSVAERTVRVRISRGKGILTIKGKNDNLSRLEYEYEIPLKDAESLIDLCEKPIIEKTRHSYFRANHHWEIDVFKGENEGLIVAEVELESEEEELQLPEWIGEEVSNDSRYYNSSLITNPFVNWKDENG
ncbi:MAG: CYTH domain-containing protein [Flavobacteriales bacterium]|nr:CYTH domain-containing protein [Flavobacteriales bacterium]